MEKSVMMLFEYHTLLFAYLGKDILDTFDTKRDKIVSSIVNFYTDVFRYKSPMTKLDGLNFINEIQNRLETEIRSIISNKSVYYWLHLYRRIGPEASFGESKTTLWLYRNMMECAFLKYGNLKCGKELIFSNKTKKISDQNIASGNYTKALKYYLKDKYESHKNTGIYLGKFEKDDLMEVYILERILYEYWYTTACKRRLFKKGILVIDRNNYYVVNDDETEELIKCYDNKERGMEDISTTSGMMLANINIDDSKGITLLPQYNVNRIRLNDYPYHVVFGIPKNVKDSLSTEEDTVPNFVWIPFDFNYYYIVHNYMRKEFKKKFNYSLECFVVSLYLLIKQAMYFSLISDKPNAGIDMMKRSYRHFLSKEKLLKELVSMSKVDRLPSLNNYELDYEEMLLLFEGLSLDEKSKKQISLTTLGPRKIFIPSNEDNFIIDYAAIPFVILTHMHFLSENDNEKGHLFEDYVIEKLKAENIKTWECKKKLKHTDGTSKEIDISFIYKNVLYIGELKCNKMSLAFTIGEESALEHRKQKIIKAITEVDEKAKWLLMHKSGTNFCVPDGVDVIVPIVVTPFTEYIWSRNDSLWINNNISRVCQPSEIKELVTDKIVSDVVKKNYAVYLV